MDIPYSMVATSFLFLLSPSSEYGGVRAIEIEIIFQKPVDAVEHLGAQPVSTMRGNSALYAR